MAEQVHDAGLHHRIGKTALIASGKPFKPSTAVLALIRDPQPELGAFRGLDPQAQNVLRAIGRVQGALGQRFLQLVEKPILEKHLLRIARRQNLVQRALLDSRQSPAFATADQATISRSQASGTNRIPTTSRFLACSSR
jgi:hypothetical protein